MSVRVRYGAAARVSALLSSVCAWLIQPAAVTLSMAWLANSARSRASRIWKASASREVVRLAIDKFDFEDCKPARDPHRQVSVRLGPNQRSMLKRFAKKKNASVGELLRFALEGLPAKKSKSR